MRNTICILICQTLFIAFAYSQVEVERSEEKTVIDGREFYLHSVSQGETLFSISQAYDISLDDLLNANPGLEGNLFIGEILRIPIPDEIDEELYIVHIVKSGETLFSLFRQYQVTEEEFYETNPDLEKTSVISIGQKLLFPRKDYVEPIKPTEIRDTDKFIYHALERGETIFALSRKYNIDRTRILTANPDIDENNLSIGQIIKVPREEVFTKTDQQMIIDSLARLNFDMFTDTVPLPDYILKTYCDSLKLRISKHNINIAVLLPFEAEDNINHLENLRRSQREQRIMPISEQMTNLLFGALIAMDKFNNLNSNINLEIFDVGRDNVVIDRLINNGDLDNMDLIVGPAFGSQISHLAKNRNNDNAIIVLPFSEDNSFIEKYSNIFMLKTSTYYQKRAILDFVNSDTTKNYILVNTSSTHNSAESTDFFNLLKNYANGHVHKLPFDGTNIVGLNNALNSDLENVVILTFTGEYRLFRVFTQLFPLKDYRIKVIGDNAIMDYHTIDPKFYLDNNFSYYTSVNVDYSNPQVVEFVESFRKEYYSEPDPISFVAYDIFNIFIKSIMYFGEKVHDCIIDQQPFNGVSGSISFARENNFAINSYSNSILYFYIINEDYSYSLVYPKKPTISVEAESDLD